MKRSITLSALFALTCIVPASAATFNLATLNDYLTGSGRNLVNHGYYTGLNGSGSLIFDGTHLAELMPWTEGTGTTQASINFTVPTMGNNASKIYMTAGDLFPIPAGQVLGQNQSGYSGDYALSNGFPLYFAFSNPTYDHNCGFNCNTITPIQVTLDSFYISGNANGLTVTGYSDLGHTAIDSIGLSGTGLQKFTFDWTGVDYIAITGGSGYYLNDIQVNEAIASPVPEPSTWVMMGIGLLGLAGLCSAHPGRRQVALTLPSTRAAR
jgi:hypothetical protein